MAVTGAYFFTIKYMETLTEKVTINWIVKVKLKFKFSI